MDAEQPSTEPEGTPAEADKRSVPLAALDGEVLLPKLRIERIERQDEAAAPKLAPFRFQLRTALIAGGAALGVAAVLVTGLYAFTAHEANQIAAVVRPDATVTALARLQDDVSKLKTGVDTLHPAADLAKQDESIRSLKKSVDVLKAEFDSLRSNDATAMSQLNAKLDKPDHDPTAKLADIMARIDKIDHDPSPKLSEITARLDRIERQISAPAATGSIAAPATKPNAAVPLPVSSPVTDKAAAPKPTTLPNWVVRDVYDGIALVQERAGGVREVTPGEFLPGAGEVRSIERRGRAWIVVTSRGIIDNSTW